MIRKYVVNVNVIQAEDGISPSFNWGYVLYSSLLEKLSKDFVESIHENNINLINHYFYELKRNKLYDKDEKCKYRWVVSLMNDEAINEVEPFLKVGTEFIINKYNAVVKIVELENIAELEEMEFCRQHLAEGDYNRKLRINFHTPTSYKTDGEYSLFPTEALIIKSAIQKWNGFSENYSVEDIETVEQLIECVKITDYNLRSRRYPLKSVTLPSFVGNVDLVIRGPEAAVRLCNMLLDFATFSGSGIKTSLGMGGIEIIYR